MLVGLSGDWDASSNDDVLPGQQSVWSLDTRETPESTIQIGPLTIRPAGSTTAAKPRTGVTKVLDKIAPKKVNAAGVVRIWGMPPAVAYTLLALGLAGAGYFAYQQLAGGGARASNPRRRRRSRGGKSRRKR